MKTKLTMKKDTIIYILLALSGYIFMYIIMSFKTLEINISLWDVNDKILMMLIGTLIDIALIGIKLNENKHKP